ncbi:MAG: hypothetical protein WD490_11270 [Opitutales bacterium]
MDRPYTVSLNLYRGAAYSPFAQTTTRILAPSVLEACSLAERNMNVALGDIEYASAVDAQPVWQPHPAVPAQTIAMAA